MITPTVRRYVEPRLFEWVMGISMIGLAAEIYLSPVVLTAPSFDLLVRVMPGQFISIFLLVFGLIRIAALVSNGKSLVYGPRFRAIGAIAGAVLWAQFSFSVIVNLPPPTLNLPFWTIFVLAELYSAYRAAGDVRN